MLDHPLLLDIFSLGTPQLRTGLGFLFFFKVSFEKHPNVDASLISLVPFMTSDYKLGCVVIMHYYNIF